ELFWYLMIMSAPCFHCNSSASYKDNQNPGERQRFRTLPPRSDSQRIRDWYSSPVGVPNLPSGTAAYVLSSLFSTSAILSRPSSSIFAPLGRHSPFSNSFSDVPFTKAG